MINKIFLVAGFMVIVFAPLFSQTPSYYHYTSSDGLASSTVYEIIQDRNGFIWFATSNGISKFDGKHFTTFRTNDGLNSNSIISLAEGNKGELYIGNYEKGINVLRDGRIENYCNTINGKNFATSYLLFTSSGKNEQKLYAYRNWGEISIMHEKISERRCDHSIRTNRHIIKLEKLPNGEIIALTTNGLFNFKNEVLSKLNISGLPDTTVYCLTKGNDGTYFIGTRQMIYRIKNNHITERYDINLTGNNDVVSILRDKKDNTWFSIMNRGFYLIPKGSDKIIDIGSKMDLQNTLVNNYLEDNEGNIWISTFGKGVYCLNNLYLKSYNEKDGLSNNNVYSIAQERSGKLLIGTFNGINIFENGRFSQVKSNSGKTLTENINSINTFNNDFYICGSFGGNEIINISYNGIRLHMLSQASFCKTSNGSYLFGQWNNSIKVQKEFNYRKEGSFTFYIFGDSTNTNRVNDIFEDTEKNVWIGTGLGLCMLSNLSDKSGKTGWKKSFFPSDSVLKSRIRSIYQDGENNVWFAGEKGIASYNLKNDSIKVYTKINGYDLSSSTSIISDNKKRIWIGNMKGLYVLDGNSIKLLNRHTGLPSDEVFSLSYDKVKNKLYIGTSNGISFFDISLFDSYAPSSLEVKILSVTAGDSVYTNYENLMFEPEQHNVYVDFRALSFSSPGSVRYKYNLDGEWLETDREFLDFISLKNGKYELQIMAKSQNSDWSEPCFISFRVMPRFIETIWFHLVVLLVLACIFIVVNSWRIKMNNKKIGEKLELSERINELKHQALSSMMNPHFIFNSLNAVQYLINCQRNEEANNYIAIMAKLVRQNLNTAGSGLILLSEEISRLKLYLDLERLRFQDSFSYEIITGTGIEPGSILIPNMIIQPFVENTLWHGIINSANRGLVTVLFSFEDVDIDSKLCKSLIIKVTDNGIGIIEARKHKKEDHISKGIHIIEERLRLLSTKMELPKPIVFEDLSNRHNNSHGTEVIISLPVPLYKIILPDTVPNPAGSVTD